MDSNEGRGQRDGGESNRANLDSLLGPINDPMMVAVTKHDSAMIAGETSLGGAAVEESQLLPDLNIGLERGQAEENENLIEAINTGLVFPTIAKCNHSLPITRMLTKP